MRRVEQAIGSGGRPPRGAGHRPSGPGRSRRCRTRPRPGPSVPAATMSSPSARWPRHSMTDHSAGAGRSGAVARDEPRIRATVRPGRGRIVLAEQAEEHPPVRLRTIRRRGQAPSGRARREVLGQARVEPATAAALARLRRTARQRGGNPRRSVGGAGRGTGWRDPCASPPPGSAQANEVQGACESFGRSAPVIVAEGSAVDAPAGAGQAEPGRRRRRGIGDTGRRSIVDLHGGDGSS